MRQTKSWLFLFLFGIILSVFASCQRTEPPSLTTAPVKEISATSALSGGNFSSDGGEEIIFKGVAWGVKPRPTIDENVNLTQEGPGSNPYISVLSGLLPGTVYYIRAYATNSTGTGYGDEIEFTTLDGVISVITSQISEVTSRSALGGGEVLDDGGSIVTSRGIVWDTAEQPTTENNAGMKYSGEGIGEFTEEITDLLPGMNYFIRAFGTNSIETAYGSTVEFKTQSEPATVKTLEIKEITSNTALAHGEITNDGGSSIVTRGFAYGTSPNPTTSGETVTAGSSPGIFSTELSALSPETSYYVRAYATNSAGTGYGNEIEFKTQSTQVIDPGSGTFNDSRDGQTYKWVKIGEQVWMAENLKYLPSVVGLGSRSETEPFYYVNGYDSTDVYTAQATETYQNYGVLYNWPAAMAGAESSTFNPSGVQGVCPPGWHLPSHDEWTQLEQHICNQLGNSNCTTRFPYDHSTWEWQGTNEGNALKSCRQVNSPLGGACNTSAHPRWHSHSIHFGTDEFGFSALPGGRLTNFWGFIPIGRHGDWWSATERSSANAWFRSMYLENGGVYRNGYHKMHGFSVRCVRDH